jgi:hypothetical protein
MSVAPAESAPAVRPVRRWWILGGAGLFLVIVAVIVVVAVLQVTAAEARNAYDVAFNDHSAAVEDLAAGQADVAATAAEVTADQIEDPALLEVVVALAQQANPAESTVARLDLDGMGTAEITAAVAELDELTAELHDQINELAASVVAVLESKDVKAIAVSRTALEASIASAEEAFAQSDGRVADDTVRDTLAARIADAKALLAAADSTPADLDSASEGINDQRDVVIAARIPRFTDIDGTWCDRSTCVVIALPNYGDSHSVISRSDGTGDGYTYMREGESCFFASVEQIFSGSGANLIYCPRGVTLSNYWVEFENANYERIYVTQAQNAEPMFRQEDQAAAFAGQ